MTQTTTINVDALAQEIRRVDGNNSLGAGALAEALIPFLSTLPIAGEAPEGWQMVPKEPTAEMIAAGEDEVTSGRHLVETYKDMLAAAPLSPSSPGKDGGQEVEAVGYRWKLHKDSPWGYGSSARTDAHVCEPVYARPQPASTELVERLTPHEFAQEYEFRGDTDYVPNDGERTMIEDAICGYLAALEEECKP